MENIQLWDKTPLLNENANQKGPSLTAYFSEGENKAAIIVCPGGAYRFLADQHEGHDIARWFQRIGISAFVLEYRLAPDYHHPCQMMDIQRAIRHLRHHAKELKLNPEKIGAIGFSAGGHLVGAASIHFNECFYPVDDIDKESARPDFSILCYPAISADERFGHQDCVKHFWGDNVSAQQLEYYSLEKNITPNVPPMFIWHTSEDEVVLVENAYVLAQALSKNKVPVELHIYPFGPHGLARADGHNCWDFPHVAQWTQSCEAWLKNIVKAID